MIEALRPVLRGDGRRLRELEAAAALKEGSSEQRAALKVSNILSHPKFSLLHCTTHGRNDKSWSAPLQAIWRSLTDSQKAQMVESSDEEEVPCHRKVRACTHRASLDVLPEVASRLHGQLGVI